MLTSPNYFNTSRVSYNPVACALSVRQHTAHRNGSLDVKRTVGKVFDGILPPEQEFGSALLSQRPPFFVRFKNRLPAWLARQFETRNKERTIKYVTWVAPALIYPPMTYFCTTDKRKEGKDNLLRQYARYAIGPFIQLGIDGVFLTPLARFKPNAFQNKAQAELTSFLAAYLCYTSWETYGVQHTVEKGRTLLNSGKPNPHKTRPQKA